MAWTTPGTAVAGDVLTAAFWNSNVRDNLIELAPFSAGWTSYTPTLAQGATSNISKTVTYAKYMRIGKIVWGQVRLDITGSGTITNDITITMPITPAYTSANQIIIGAGYYFDSGSAFYIVQTSLSNSLISLAYGAGGAVGRVPNLAVASGDQFVCEFTYEAA